MPIIKTLRTVEVPDRFICDQCQTEYPDTHDMVEIDHTFGYYSDYDMMNITAVICENCYHSLLSSIKNANWTQH